MEKNISLFCKPDAAYNYSIVAQFKTPFIIEGSFSYVKEGRYHSVNNFQIIPTISYWEFSYIDYIPKKEDCNLIVYDSKDTITLYFGKDLTGKTEEKLFHILYNPKISTTNNTIFLNLCYGDEHEADLKVLAPIGKDYFEKQYGIISISELNIDDSNIIKPNKSDNIDNGAYYYKGMKLKIKNYNIYNTDYLIAYIQSSGYALNGGYMELFLTPDNCSYIIPNTAKDLFNLYREGNDIYVEVLSYIHFKILNQNLNTISIINEIPENATLIDPTYRISDNKYHNNNSIFPYIRKNRWGYLGNYLCGNVQKGSIYKVNKKNIDGVYKLVFYIKETFYSLNDSYLEILKKEAKVIALTDKDIHNKLRIYSTEDAFYIVFNSTFDIIEEPIQASDIDIVTEVPSDAVSVEIINRAGIDLSTYYMYKGVLQYSAYPYLVENKVCYGGSSLSSIAGTWSQRPNADGSSIEKGFQYFLLESTPDTSPEGSSTEKLTGDGKPIWWTGEKWVDGTGAEV